MKHAIIVAHPSPKSLAHSVARAYASTVAMLGQPSLMRDLYALDFDPRLKADEIPRLAGFQFGEHVVRERKLLADADAFAFAFAFIYPFWFTRRRRSSKATSSAGGLVSAPAWAAASHCCRADA